MKKKMLWLSPLVFGLTLMSFKSADTPTETAKPRFYTDYNTHEEELADAKKLNLDLQEESSVLMKNENNVLPFDSRVKNVTVFGHAGYDYRSGGGGSGSSGTDSDATVTNALENAGLHVNQRVMDLNRDWAENHATTSGSGWFATKSVTEMPTSFLKSAEGSYTFYKDAAIIVVSRPGSEFSDNKAYDVAGHKDKTDHILEFEDNEIELIKYVRGQGFDKVVVLVNSASPMELGPIVDGELKDYVDSVLWIGFTGQNGILAIGDLLTGVRSPSGRTVDIYPRDFKNDPTWNNFSDGQQVGVTTDGDGNVVTTNKATITDKNGNAYKAWGSALNDDGTSKNNGTAYTEVDYEEGIYVGYRYYETRSEVEDAKESATKDAWYKENVVFPFGYGLSYTNFSYEMVTTTGQPITSSDQEIEVKVKVKNIGDRAGKDVVQLYYSSEYTTGGIEKASANLGTFAKTDLLKPGEEQTLSLKFAAREMADFDYNDANGNDFAGYELEAGNYTISLRKNSHELIGSDAVLTYTVAQAEGDTATKGKTGIKVTTSAKTNKEIKAQFSGEGFENTNKVGVTVADQKAKNGLTYMSRANFAETFPTAPTADDLKYTDEALAYLDGQYADYAYEDKSTDPWYKASVPSAWTQLSDTEAASKPTAADRDVDLTTMIGKDIDDEGWDAILNKLSWSEMCAYLNGNSRQMKALEGVGKMREVDDDGPAQLKNSSAGKSGVAWVSEVNVAATYNIKLAEEQGVMMGNDALFVGVTGWYGPAADTHRSPLSGRNFEYYSQDGVQGGLICAAVIKGAQSKGVHTYLKHFALNDQEMNRGTAGGVITYCNEQAMRQIYLKAFEYAFTQADCNGTMSAFNRIGMNKSVNWNLYHNILQDEWGFKGVSDSDIGGNVQTGYDFVRCNAYPMGNNSRAGNEFEGVWDETKKMVMVAKDATEYASKTATLESPTQWYWVRNTVQRSLWTYCNTSGIQNGVKVNEIVGKTTLTGEVGAAISSTQGDLTVSDAITGGSSDVKYEMVSGSLPNGVTFSNGKLSGTPTSSGEYLFTVRVTIDGWVKKEVEHKLVVASAFSLSKTTTKVGDDYSDKIATELVTEDAGYSNIAYSVVSGELPEGLTIAEDGTISGKATKAGSYTFTVQCSARQGSGWFSTTYRYTETFTIVVSAADAGTVTDPVAEAKKEAEEAKAAAATANAEIEKLKTEIESLKSDDSKSGGCGGSVIIATSAIGAIALIGAGLALKKRKEDK